MKTLGIITYDHAHLKTEQILLALHHRHRDTQLIVYALPFQPRKKREVLIPHRPDQENAAHPQDLCQSLGYPYIYCRTDADIDNRCDLYLITGAGILSQQAVENKRILNCHPGILPMSRGLDAFKWAIYRKQPVGNTLHFIDKEVDGGQIIAVRQTPLFLTDSLLSFARRHYEYEIQMLQSFETYMTAPENPFYSCEPGEPTRRMNLAAEGQMCRMFEEYKEQFAVRNTEGV